MTRNDDPHDASGPPFGGRRLAIVGRFAAVSARQVSAAVKRHGGAIDPDAPELVVIGDLAAPRERDEAKRLAADCGAEVLEEASFWSRLGLLGEPTTDGPSYSAAELAEMVGVPTSAVRRWTRRGLLQPSATFGGLGSLGFAEARVAKSLAGLLKGGVTLAGIERAADQLAAAYPRVSRPLAELPVRAIDGKVVVAEGDRHAEATGQHTLPFGDARAAVDVAEPTILPLPDAGDPIITQRRRAWWLYNEGDVEAAIEAWRLTLLQTEPTADDHFVLAEWLGESGRDEAARERLYAALELDDDHIEARLALARSLATLGDQQLAIATLEGALQREDDNADLHFELAQLHTAIGDEEAGQTHWRRFAELAPTDPRANADEASVLAPPLLR